MRLLSVLAAAGAFQHVSGFVPTGLGFGVAASSNQSPLHFPSTAFARESKSLFSSTMEPSVGFNTRLDDAFRASKDKDEAAFIGFITAGYPSKVRK